MRLAAASQRASSQAEPLPVPYPAMRNAGILLRAGQVSLTVAAPGIGKSQFWLNISQRTGVPTVFWSADTDAHDVLSRVTSLWTGWTSAEAEHNSHDPAWAPLVAERIAAGNHVEWVFESVVSSKLLAERLNAHAEIHGTYPRLVVVDNLANVVRNEAEEAAEQRAFIKDCQALARATGAHVAILAHATGEYDTGTKPIPQGGVYNKLTKIPEVVLTLHRADEAGLSLGLNAVKNRGGRSDPAASHPIHFDVDYSRAAVHGFRSAA